MLINFFMAFLFGLSHHRGIARSENPSEEHKRFTHPKKRRVYNSALLTEGRLVIEIPADTRLQTIGLTLPARYLLVRVSDSALGDDPVPVHVFEPHGERRVGRPDQVDARIAGLLEPTISIAIGWGHRIDRRREFGIDPVIFESENTKGRGGTDRFGPEVLIGGPTTRDRNGPQGPPKFKIKPPA